MKKDKAIKILRKHSKKLVKDTRHAHFAVVEKRGNKFVLNLLVTKTHSSHNQVKAKKLKEKKTDTEALDVTVTISKPITAFAARTDKWRPAPGGVSIGHYNITAGTLGCTVYKNATKYILSNNHVLADCNDGEVEDAVYQPGPYDGGTIDDKIGELFEYVELLFGGDANKVDCALCLPDVAADVADSIIDLEYPTAIEEPTIGNAVVKSGRTTGTREGTILGIGYGWVGYGPKGQAWFEDQIITTNISTGGDSGSLVVDKNSGVAVGLLFAGSNTITVANKMTEVASELSITLLDQKNVDDEANVELNCSVAVDVVTATPIANQADNVELSNSVAVEVGTGQPIANQADAELSCSVSFEVIQAIRVELSATVYLNALVSNYGYAHYGTNDLSGLYRIADDSLEGYELYRGQDVEPDFDAAPWETFATLPHTSDVVMDMDLRPNCVTKYKMNDDAYSPWVAGLNGVPTENVQNPYFINDSIWTWGNRWSWYAPGARAYRAPGVNAGNLEQNVGAIAGKTYLTVFIVIAYVDGNLAIELGGEPGTLRSANGVYIEVITAGASPAGVLAINPGSGEYSVSMVCCICLDDFPLTGVFCDSGEGSTIDHSVAGKINKALYFNGVNDRILVYDEGALEFGPDTQDFSIAIWFKRARTGIEFLLAKADAAGDGWLLFFHPVTHVIAFYLNTKSIWGATPINDTDWHLVKIVVDRDGNAQIYLDNVADGAAVDVSGETMSISDPLHIGENYLKGNHFQGDIDVTTFFDKALSEAERDWRWNGGNGREGLVEAKTYHFATRLRNKYNLISQNITSWDLEVNEDGDVLYNPAAPQNISIAPAAGAKGLVKAQYIYDPDKSNTATTWLIYFTDDGTDPDPDSDTPTEVAMYKANGIAHLNWLSPAADDDDILKVIVRTRATISSINYDSQNTDIYSCTAKSDGPAAPTGRAFFDKVAEAM